MQTWSRRKARMAAPLRLRPSSRAVKGFSCAARRDCGPRCPTLTPRVRAANINFLTLGYNYSVSVVPLSAAQYKSANRCAVAAGFGAMRRSGAHLARRVAGTAHRCAVADVGRRACARAGPSCRSRSCSASMRSCTRSPVRAGLQHTHAQRARLFGILMQRVLLRARARADTACPAAQASPAAS